MSERRGVRRQAREAALQALFMCDFHNTWSREMAEFCLEHFSVPPSAREYARLLANGVIESLGKIDSRLTAASDHWSISRMSRVDRVILRIAVFEMFYRPDVPVGVAIDEAVEIAKRFGADESPMFVNGVLDRAASALKRAIEIEQVSAAAANGDTADIPFSPGMPIADSPLKLAKVK